MSYINKLSYFTLTTASKIAFYLPKVVAKSYMAHLMWSAVGKFFEEGAKEAAIEVAGGVARAGGGAWGVMKGVTQETPNVFRSCVSGSFTSCLNASILALPKIAYESVTNGFAFGGAVKSSLRKLL